MLIEPDRSLAKQYWSVLEEAGHEVIICLSGQLAIVAADEQTPDVVILELLLKKHNGIEFLYEFSSYPEWQSVPIIIQTLVPHEKVQGAPALKQVNLKKYIYKPSSSLKTLVQAVDETLQKNKVAVQKHS